MQIKHNYTKIKSYFGLWTLCCIRAKFCSPANQHLHGVAGQKVALM